VGKSGPGTRAAEESDQEWNCNQVIRGYGFFFKKNMFLTQFFKFHLLKMDNMTCHLAFILSENKVN
jgi:hypothetical protein